MIDESGRVVCRRCKEENRMIVSYMPFLTELMDSHLNVHLLGETIHQMARENSTASKAYEPPRYSVHLTAAQCLLIKHTEFYRQFIHIALAQAFKSNLNQWPEWPSLDINIPQIVSALVGADIISRLTFIWPCKGEVFFSRALLVHKAA